MAESNGAWGGLAAHDDGLASDWDKYRVLPEPGEDEILDRFCERKNLDIPSLLRLGARMSDPTTLVFAYEGGLKYRDMVTDRRWSTDGWEPLEQRCPLKMVPHRVDGKPAVLVAESETDAARLSMLYPQCDIAIMPAGAKAWWPWHPEQLKHYDVVYVCLDKDEAGNIGAAKISESLPQAVRFAAPGVGDWGDALEAPPLPDPPAPRALIVFGSLEDLNLPEQASWLENELLPMGGSMMVHGPAKSFKSFLTLDLAAALATANPWCHFQALQEPAKVAVVQFEIPPAYYAERVAYLKAKFEDDTEFQQNFGTYMPYERARFNARSVDDKARLTEALQNAGIEILLFDPVRRAMRGASMNDEAELDVMLGYFDELNVLGITTIAVHHDNKSNPRGGDPENMTGSARFEGDADTIISIEIPKKYKKRDPQRNVNFLLRNAPSPESRAFEMDPDTSTLIYKREPFAHSVDDENEPEI